MISVQGCKYPFGIINLDLARRLRLLINWKGKGVYIWYQTIYVCIKRLEGIQAITILFVLWFGNIHFCLILNFHMILQARSCPSLYISTPVLLTKKPVESLCYHAISEYEILDVIGWLLVVVRIIYLDIGQY